MFAHSVKSVIPLSQLKTVRSWLLANCGRRWHATNFKNESLNWRIICKRSPYQVVNDMLGDYSYTAHIHFKHWEDMMLFLLSWHGEVLINTANDSKISTKVNK